MYYEYVLRCVCRRATRCRFSSVRGILFLHCNDAELGNHHRHRTIIYVLRTSCLFASPSYSFSADSPCACGKNYFSCWMLAPHLFHFASAASGGVCWLLASHAPTNAARSMGSWNIARPFIMPFLPTAGWQRGVIIVDKM